MGRDYLVDTYRSRIFRIFRPVDIAGLPAVEQQTGYNPSSCTITVGVADGQALDEQFDVEDLLPDGQPVVDPCAEGRRVLEAVVSTLPPLPR